MPKKSSSKQSPSGKGASPATSKKAAAESDLPKSAGYLIACDIPTKQYIQYLNGLKEPADKKFIIADLDGTHLLVKQKAKDEILRKVEEWEDSNVYSMVEKVGDDFDVS